MEKLWVIHVGQIFRNINGETREQSNPFLNIPFFVHKIYGYFLVLLTAIVVYAYNISDEYISI